MKYTCLFLLILTLACGQQSNNQQLADQNQVNKNVQSSHTFDLINTDGTTLNSRISTPDCFQRIPVAQNSFAEYLRYLPLKPFDSEVMLYNGSPKPNTGVYISVVDLDIGSKNLHQCADAVMRLRAEYLWIQKQYDQIHFNFTNGFRVDYSEWMAGKRIMVEGNNSYWVQKTSASNSYEDFWEYMEIIFTYAGTLSLSQEMKSIDITELAIGDVFIQGGSPGHAVIVVDLALDLETREKLFLLAQSYMPAQEIQILKNPNNSNISPWYSLNFDDKLQTPEWTFNKTDLKRFED